MENFACGWLAGAAGVLVLHPLDNLRVMVQTDSAVQSSLPRAAHVLWRAEGIAGFFKGLLSPIFSIGLWKGGIFFAVRAWFLG